MSTELHRLCGLDEIVEGAIMAGRLPDGHAVAIYKVDGEVYVSDDHCTHGDASLSEEGTLDGCTVECAWHFGAFDVRTGQPTASPCTEPLRTYQVTVNGEAVFVAVKPVIAIAAAASSAATASPSDGR